MHYNMPGCGTCKYLQALAEDIEHVSDEDLPNEVYELAQQILQHSYDWHRMGLDKATEVCYDGSD